MKLRFSDEAEQIICRYLKEVGDRMNELGPKIDSQLRKTLLNNVKHHLRHASLKNSWKRGSLSVETEDVYHALKRFATPEKLVKKRILNPRTFPSFRRLWLNRLNTIRAKLREASEPWLLDAGCGWGRTLFECENYEIKGEFVGVDTDKLSLRYGRLVGHAMHWIAADIQGTLPFKDQAFDTIVCRAVLHETEKSDGYQKAIREFARVLKPRGLLHITDTFAKFRFLTSLLRIARKMTTKLERFHHISHVKTALEQSGFKRVKTEKMIPRSIGDIYMIVATR